MSRAQFRLGYAQTLRWMGVDHVPGSLEATDALIDTVRNTLRPEADAFYLTHTAAIEAGTFQLGAKGVAWHAGHEFAFVRLERKAAFDVADWGAVAAAAMTADALALAPFRILVSGTGVVSVVFGTRG